MTRSFVVARLHRQRVGVVDVHQLAVRIVLDDQEVVLRRDPQHLGAALLRHQPSGRILKVRDRVQQLRLRPRRNLGQRLRNDAVVILLDAGELALRA